jgi:hypothetical protein
VPEEADDQVWDPLPLARPGKVYADHHADISAVVN